MARAMAPTPAGAWAPWPWAPLAWPWPPAWPLETAVSVDASTAVATMPRAFVGFNLDWHVDWGDRNAMRLDLTDPALLGAVRALSPATLRVGGTPGDSMVYDVRGDGCRGAGGTIAPHYCLPMARFDALVRFCERAGLELVFQLNALTFRPSAAPGCAVEIARTDERSPWEGQARARAACADAALDTANIDALFAHAAARGLRVPAFELGNELQEISPEAFGRDLAAVGRLLAQHWPDARRRPRLLGASLNPRESPPADAAYYPRLVDAAGGALDGLTYHVYVARGGGSAAGPEAVARPAFLDEGLRREAEVVAAWRALRRRRRRRRPRASPAQRLAALVPAARRSGGGDDGRARRSLRLLATEAAALWHSGQHGITDTFADVFWYADALAARAARGHAAFCRQTLAGGDYALLGRRDAAGLRPNADFWVAWLFRRLMGRRVLAAAHTPRERAAPAAPPPWAEAPLLAAAAPVAARAAATWAALTALERGGGARGGALPARGAAAPAANELRVYAHCTPRAAPRPAGVRAPRAGLARVTLQLINLAARPLRLAALGGLPGALGAPRHEYELASATGALDAPAARLNGHPLRLGAAADGAEAEADARALPSPPPLAPLGRVPAAGEPLIVRPLTAKWVVFEGVHAPGCARQPR